MKKYLSWVGGALTAAGIVFIAIRFQLYWKDLNVSRVQHVVWVALFLLAVVYGFANLLLVSAWQKILDHLGVQVTRAWSVRVYGISQLAKYVPGNVFHLAGRQLIGTAAGAPTVALANSMLWEFGLIVLAGSLYGGFVLLVLWMGGAGWILALSVLIVAGCVGASFKSYLSVKLLMSLVGQMMFLAVLGALFVAVVMMFDSRGAWLPENVVLIGAVYILAWLVGLITPGAPAGIGIRESVLLVLLEGVVPDADCLMAALSVRVITMGGDILFFLAALSIPSANVYVANGND